MEKPAKGRRRSTNREVMVRIYPERSAGDFSRDDDHVAIFSRVRALMPENARVLDFGAGRGKSAEMFTGYRLKLVTLKGSCDEVVGYDVDEGILQNTLVDKQVHGKVDEALPFDDESFDVVVSWATIEHLGDAEFYARELERVLKPGGWFCAWTPSKWGYYAIAARFTPDATESAILKVFNPGRHDFDVFPKFYRMNTLGQLRSLFPEKRFSHHSYYYSGPPRYHGGWVWLARFWNLYNMVMPGVMKPALHVFVQKRDS